MLLPQFPFPHDGCIPAKQEGCWGGMGTGQRYSSPIFPAFTCVLLPFFGSKGARPTTPQLPWWQRSSKCWSSTCRMSGSEYRWSQSWAGRLCLGGVPMGPACIFFEVFCFVFILPRNSLFPFPREIFFTAVFCLFVCFKQDLEQKMKVVENLQDDFDFNYKTLKSQGGKWILETLKSPIESELC